MLLSVEIGSLQLLIPVLTGSQMKSNWSIWTEGSSNCLEMLLLNEPFLFWSFSPLMFVWRDWQAKSISRFGFSRRRSIYFSPLIITTVGPNRHMEAEIHMHYCARGSRSDSANRRTGRLHVNRERVRCDAPPWKYMTPLELRKTNVCITLSLAVMKTWTLPL